MESVVERDKIYAKIFYFSYTSTVCINFIVDNDIFFIQINMNFGRDIKNSANKNALILPQHFYESEFYIVDSLPRIFVLVVCMLWFVHLFVFGRNLS